MDGYSHFISFPKLVSRTGKLLLLTNWPIESRTAVYNVSDQRVILAYFGLIHAITSYLLSTYLYFRSLYLYTGQERHKDRQTTLKQVIS